MDKLTLLALTLLACSPVAAQSPCKGVYIGTFSGISDNGHYGFLVTDSNSAKLVGFDLIRDEGVFDDNIPVDATGAFSESQLGGVAGDAITGSLTYSGVTGTFESSSGGSGTFEMVRKPDAGSLVSIAGYHVGSYAGSCPGQPAGGLVRSVVAADGSIVFFIRETVFDDLDSGMVATIAANCNLFHD